jgi:hypothetical protein
MRKVMAGEEDFLGNSNNLSERETLTQTPTVSVTLLALTNAEHQEEGQNEEKRNE